MSSEAPLFRFKAERPQLVSEVCRRSFNDFVAMSQKGDTQGLEYALNEAAFMEIERMQRGAGEGDEIRSIAWWRAMSKRLTVMSEPEKRELLWSLTQSYSEDIAGKFNPMVYKMATGALPIGLSFLFKTQDIKDMPLPTNLKHVQTTMKHIRDLSERVQIQGETETLKSLARKGTLVFVPTHSSNMDSILLGWSMHSAGLPPVTYGAGKNLFTNPLTGFFMHNLGAYKVDRRVQHKLYKEILKTYSQVLLERGYHSLFFPGGTRCRSNIVETHLKLGLLGTAISGYVHKLLQDPLASPLYICPITINYNLILEADSLIHDHLRAEGRGRYFLENDEFNQLSTVARFVMNTVRMDSTTVIRFGQPMDPFGNRVEADGMSYDSHGRIIDPRSYVRSARTGEIGYDASRDRQYTRYTGTQISDAFLSNTVIMPTQLVSYVLFDILEKRYPRWDVFRLLRFGTDEMIAWEELHRGVDAVLSRLKELANNGGPKLSPMLLEEKADSIVYAGLDYLRMYHIPVAVERYTDGVMLNRLELIYFYGNRLRTYEALLREKVAA
ncbi:MAG: 1-acyl-sn-glycerol-3-phosphate acyltransferase [Bradymonadaceae bacterium]|nr:1-acyl-sn-glycerol-3-phosphate acyltransferase [Lujinxingiaceae bacterium]